MVSNSDTYNPPSVAYDNSTIDTGNYSGGQRPRYDSNALLMLPAPLAVNRPMMSSSTSIGVSRSSEDASDLGSHSHQRLIPSPQSAMTEQYNEVYDSPPTTYDPHSPRVAYTSNTRSPAVSSPSGEAYNPFRNVVAPGYDDLAAYTPETEEFSPVSLTNPSLAANRASRGVRLTDSGPVPGPEGVRRVSRPTGRRPTSQAPPQNRYSRPGSMYALPPGAAPPQPTGSYSGSN
jgi:chitin synthase